LTPDERARLRALHEKATPGPWHYERDDEGSSMGWVAAGEELLFNVRGDSAQQEVNAETACNSVNALPALLDALDAQDAERRQDDRKRMAAAVASGLGTEEDMPEPAVVKYICCRADAILAELDRTAAPPVNTPPDGKEDVK
jgi:hypothetical protein